MCQQPVLVLRAHKPVEGALVGRAVIGIQVEPRQRIQARGVGLLKLRRDVAVLRWLLQLGNAAVRPQVLELRALADPVHQVSHRRTIDICR